VCETVEVRRRHQRQRAVAEIHGFPRAQGRHAEEGPASPDDGDALALTFAYPVAKRDWLEERRFEEGLQRLKRWVR
jgi:hypothetical protein